MILDFPGGVKPLARTQLGKSKIENTTVCSAVCLEAEADAKAYLPAGCSVKRATLLGESGGTPVYASVAGMFRGIMELEGKRYFVVMNGGKEGEEDPTPEQRAITELTPEDIIESAKRYAVAEPRYGVPLWKLIEKANGKCRRLIIDCTESDALSATNYRLCIERAKSAVGGAKLLLRASGALKCVFAAEHYRNAAFSSLLQYATDEKLFATAQLDEKYPYGDRAIMEALYLKTLEFGEDPIDCGFLIVSPEAAAALYDAMRDGIPMLDRYITVCGEGITNSKNLRVPRGITIHDISNICGGIKKGYTLIENSLLSGTAAKGALSDSIRTLIAAKKQARIRTECTSCGLCAEACPLRLMPLDILAGEAKLLRERCVSCGACEYICPSGIPLVQLIKNSCDKAGEEI